MPETPPRVLIVLGSTSDEEVAKKAEDILTEFGIEYEVAISSAHRNPEGTARIARLAVGHGVKVIIAGAGLSAALPGVIAAHTTLPVIGIPINADNSFQGGTDAVCGILQMPPGIPVACVGINNSRNAALLAAAILALHDPRIAAAIANYRAQWNAPEGGGKS